MKQTRRTLLAAAALALGQTASGMPRRFDAGDGPREDGASGPASAQRIGDRLDPWIELDRARYAHNARAIAKCAGGRPVIAVLKNDAYGLGVRQVASILDGLPEIRAFALVHGEDALALREDGVRKPILLMARHATSEGLELARADVTLSVFSDDDPERFGRLSERLGRPVLAHLYVDTGLGRMGRWHDRIGPWIDDFADSIRLEGALTMLTSDSDFVPEQLARFARVREDLRRRGIEPALFHAASSSPMLHHPASRLDAVRPGILLHGSLPAGGQEETALVDVRVTFRLRAGVVRVERLPAGSTLGFSRFYELERPTWIATVPIGWGDGYPSAAEEGAVVVAKGRHFPVVNVNGNHTNLLLGEEKGLDVGDAVTLVGHDDPAVTPEGMAERIGGHNYRQIDYKGYLRKVVT